MVADSKESACNAGYPGSIPGLRRFLGKGNGYPFQYSCLENSMDRGAWWAAVHGITKSQTGVSDLTLSHFHHRISLIFVCVCVCLCVCVCVCVCTQSYPTLHNTFGLQSARLFCPQNFSGKNTRVGCHFLLQGIFPTQGLKLCCLHYR